MTISKQNKQILCIDSLRHNEYYGLQEKFDELYSRSKEGYEFNNLMDLILSRENILLAYRNIKTNNGSRTPGTDKVTIEDISKLTAEEVIDKVRFITTGSTHGYRPKPVRRKDIPKPNGKTRPLGIPCMWDRLIQQCIKQVMEPICEAKFSENSYGFRPNRSVEHAIASTYKLMQVSHLNWVIEFDIKGFFDNVNHSKLIKQIWAMGIHDKHLIYILKQILKAPIRMPDGTTVNPTKGTPQGGIISPLLANVVLNELDHWVESQWQRNPIIYNYSHKVRKNGATDYSAGYTSMKRTTKLKQMLIVRYADDFRIFCNSKAEAERTKIAITKWLSDRLKLEISEEKTRIVNTRTSYMEFLGFKIKLHRKGDKYVVTSRMSDKALKQATKSIVEQAKKVTNPSKGKTGRDEIVLYNYKVLGIQNYYQLATDIIKDVSILGRRAMTIYTNRLRSEKGTNLIKKGRELTNFEKERYGPSKMVRFIAGINEPIYPIDYMKHKNPLLKRRAVNSYTKEGREAIHENLRINHKLLLGVMLSSVKGRSIEYSDNRISLFSAQLGKCAVTNKEFETVDEIHCHHILPRSEGGKDKYDNLCLVHKDIHKLIHANSEDIIKKYLSVLRLESNQIDKINRLRENAGLKPIQQK